MKLLLSVFCAALFLIACNSGSNKQAELLKAKQMTVDSMKAVISKQAVIDSMNTVMANREEKNRQVVVNNSVSPQTQNTPQTKKKRKKWNNTAKGAVIGAGTGAVAGALIDKNHGKGAIVGGLIGAGVGTATGLVVDGSNKRKNKAN